jgi:quercetin 2,3-dioxygenase
MIEIRRSEERGRFNHGWLYTQHSFSFSEYYNPKAMGFRQLRVINEDRVVPGEGFGTHPHSDMEIITYVLDGALEHKDSTGGGSVLRPGMVQRMSAGRGVTHSEFNHSAKDPVHFLQIWIIPEKKGLEPSYEEKSFSVEDRTGRLRLIAARDARDGALTVHQDVDLYASILAKGQAVTHVLAPGRHAWLQVARGKVMVGATAADRPVRAGDAAVLSDEPQLTVQASEDSEFLLFDLA